MDEQRAAFRKDVIELVALLALAALAVVIVMVVPETRDGLAWFATMIKVGLSASWSWLIGLL
jgi:hypothetical protein